MRFVARLLAGSALCFVGCGVAHDAAVGSYRVATAPFRLFHHPSPTPAPRSSETTVTTTHSDVRSAGHSLPKSSPVTALPQHRSTRYGASPSPSPNQSRSASVTGTKPKSTPTVQTPPPEENFPTAKPVPEKPGYVFSPFEPAKYVDVSGFPRGSKVKDPYSGKIFLVP